MTPWTCPIDGTHRRYADGRCKDCTQRKQRRYHRKNYKNARAMILKALGGKCSVCGFSDARALQIDHKRGGGTRMRRKLQGSRYYPAILAELHLGKYDLLCANHHAIKKANRKEHTRRKP
jgi:hypothetical protein